MTIDEILQTTPRTPWSRHLRPAYAPRNGKRLCLALEPYRRHMTDEGSLLQEGLAYGHYHLRGAYLPYDDTDVERILDDEEPGTVFVQDIRDWMPGTSGCYDPNAGFINWQALGEDRRVFRVTVLKDAHAAQKLQEGAHALMGIHAWLVYYHPRLVAGIAPWVRPQDLIRIYHCVHPGCVPKYTADRKGCLLAGALSDYHYPLRTRLAKLADSANGPIEYLKHPGYGAVGTATPSFLQTMSRYKVAVCTCSIWGFALRKTIEATACGCVVIANLPEDDKLPDIDANIIRIRSEAANQEILDLVRYHIDHYDAEKQAWLSDLATASYDFRRVGRNAADAIELLRRSYNHQG